jgi:hypothetical protein
LGGWGIGIGNANKKFATLCRVRKGCVECLCDYSDMRTLDAKGTWVWRTLEIYNHPLFLPFSISIPQKYPFLTIPKSWIDSRMKQDSKNPVWHTLINVFPLSLSGAKIAPHTVACRSPPETHITHCDVLSFRSKSFIYNDMRVGASFPKASYYSMIGAGRENSKRLCDEAKEEQSIRMGLWLAARQMRIHSM